MSKFHLWLQERIKRRTKPATPALISELLADLPLSRTDLVIENTFLCQQLIVFFFTLRSSGNKPYTSFSQTPVLATYPSAQNYEVKLN